MNSYAQKTMRHQRGMATLAVSLLMLFLVTLVTLYTANTSVTEQRITSNQNRSEQSIAAAKAGVDWALAYYDANGVDLGDDGIVDADKDSAKNITINDVAGGNLSVSFNVFYCDPNAAELLTDPLNCPLPVAPFGVGHECEELTVVSCLDKHGVGIVVRGFSDDGSAQHIITVGGAGVNILKDIPAPLTTRGFVADSGNVKIINRYRNATIWSGRSVAIGSSASAGTYILDPVANRSLQSRTDLIDQDEGSAITIPASFRDRGNNSDVRENDTNLNKLSGDELFESIVLETKEEVKARAAVIEQYFVTGEVFPDPITGIVWVEGDYTLNGGAVGTVDDPAVLVINGNLTTAGNPVIYGLLYVSGDWDAGGTVVMSGAAVVEGATSLSSVAGLGTLNLVYDPESLNGGTKGTRGMVAGTWKDW